jgi:hypothetical protein
MSPTGRQRWNAARLSDELERPTEANSLARRMPRNQWTRSDEQFTTRRGARGARPGAVPGADRIGVRRSRGDRQVVETAETSGMLSVI